jgi:hypothetical protein
MTACVLGHYADPDVRPPNLHYAVHLATPLYRGPSTLKYFDGEYRLCLTDTRTGATGRCSIQGLDSFDVLACAPWRDAQGNHHLLVRYQSAEGEGGARRMLEMGLALCSYPAGAVLGRVSLSPPPVGSVCWDPDRSDRIVYLGGDGQLHSYTFSAGEARGLSLARAEPITWESTPPWAGGVFFKDLCWPIDPAWRGALIAAIYRPGYPWRHDDDLKLWALRLDPDGARIVAAECVLDLTGTELALDQARLLSPAAGTSPDGTRLLAFLEHDQRRKGLTLWVAPVAAGWEGSGTTAPRSAPRRVASRCCRVEPAFSPDGRWLYATVKGRGASEARVVRFPVFPEDHCKAPAHRRRPCRPDPAEGATAAGALVR